MLSDAALDDQFSHPECEEGRQVFVVNATSALTDTASGTVSWLAEIQGNLLAGCESVFTDSADRFVE